MKPDPVLAGETSLCDDARSDIRAVVSQIEFDGDFGWIKAVILPKRLRVASVVVLMMMNASAKWHTRSVVRLLVRAASLSPENMGVGRVNNERPLRFELLGDAHATGVLLDERPVFRLIVDAALGYAWFGALLACPAKECRSFKLLAASHVIGSPDSQNVIARRKNRTRNLFAGLQRLLDRRSIERRRFHRAQ